MGKIVVATNATLDGVVQDPDGLEGSARGRWFPEPGSADFDAWAELETREALGAEAMLMGRRTDDWFATRWTSREGVWADKLNGLPKYVVSTTLDRPRWTNATVLRGDVATEVAALKEEVDGEILVYASYRLVRTLLEHDLLDELRLVVFPVVLGAGERLFDGTDAAKALSPVSTRRVGDGLVLHTYEFVR
jgi:dihydrofolate reductase